MSEVPVELGSIVIAPAVDASSLQTVLAVNSGESSTSDAPASATSAASPASTASDVAPLAALPELRRVDSKVSQEEPARAKAPTLTKQRTRSASTGNLRSPSQSNLRSGASSPKSFDGSKPAAGAGPNGTLAVTPGSPQGGSRRQLQRSASAPGGKLVEPELKITFEELLENKRKAPLSGDDFREFLKKQFADENWDFVVDVQKLKPKLKERPVRWRWSIAASDAFVVLCRMIRKCRTRQKRCCPRYCTPANCALTAIVLLVLYNRQRSRSERVRRPATRNNRACSLAQSCGAADCEPSLCLPWVKQPSPSSLQAFNAAQAEILSMLRSGNYLAPFVTEAKQNITKGEANNRYFIAAVFFVIAFLLALVSGYSLSPVAKALNLAPVLRRA